MPEFDRIAADYSAGFDDPMKRIFGDSAKSFLASKLRLLDEAIRKARPDLILQSAKLLDFGCGAGDFLNELSEIYPSWIFEGCDVSPGMLAEARKRLGLKAERIKLWKMDDGALGTGKYDVIAVVCVLHHIAPAEWARTLLDLGNALKPGGVLAVFEHNPWNPVTRWMVSRTEVDHNAILLSAPDVKRNLPSHLFATVELKNFLFVPPRLNFLGFCESCLNRIPFGGQYALFCVKR